MRMVSKEVFDIDRGNKIHNEVVLQFQKKLKKLLLMHFAPIRSFHMRRYCLYRFHQYVIYHKKFVETY